MYAKSVYLTPPVFFSNASLGCNVFLGLLLMHTFHPSNPVNFGKGWLTGLAYWYVSSLELSKNFTPVSVVINSSSVTSAFPNMAIITFGS